MRAKMFPLLTFVALFGAILISNSCGSSKNCPVCGTDKNGTVGLIDVMLVPEHNPNGEPGGPFNIFDISWVDPTNRLTPCRTAPVSTCRCSARPPTSRSGRSAGDNSVAEAG